VLERTLDAHEHDPAWTSALDAQFVAGLQAGSPECVDRYGDLVLCADPSSAPPDTSFLYFLHTK
jgi:hypothetical protein